MINFPTLQSLTIPEGVVTQIEIGGKVVWAVQSGSDTVILEVEKITSDTYAGETTYTGEEFILLDIYPKTNGTVKVTYGGLTKTITDTSGAEEPNAQKVYFGTFNGVSDEVITPTRGTLTIEGDYYAFAVPVIAINKMLSASNNCLRKIISWGEVTKIPTYFMGHSTMSYAPTEFEDTSINIPPSVVSIGTYAFTGLSGVERITIGSGVTSIGDYNPFMNCFETNKIIVDSSNTAYKIDGNCLIEIATNAIIAGFTDSVIPSYVTTIKHGAFAYLDGLESITIPASVKSIDSNAFKNCPNLKTVYMLADSPPQCGGTIFDTTSLEKIVVPAGSLGKYTDKGSYDGSGKSPMYDYADYIVEES